MINTIRYMGSKRKLITKLNEIFKKSSKNTFFDIFAGSGVVSLNNNFNNVISNDIQKYSSIIINGSTKPFPLILKNEILKITSNWSETGFIEENYSGIFFSKKQSKFLDALRSLAFNKEENQDLILYIGIKMMFLMQNSPGHFAAVLKKTERSKKILALDPKKILEVVFEKWEFINKKIITKNLDSLEVISKNDSIYYMDPPYTVDQYSRFYHLLESFVKEEESCLDNNKVKYASDRFKSKFSNKKMALEEFEKHISKIYSLKSDVVISYFTNGVVSEKDIFKLIENKYKIKGIDYVEYKHSSMGGKPKKAKEVIIWGFYE